MHGGEAEYRILVVKPEGKTQNEMPCLPTKIHRPNGKDI
jgi:hypothetical protein